MSDSAALVALPWPEHVCIKSPCVFCMVNAGSFLHRRHLVQPIPVEKRVVLERIAKHLQGLDLGQLLALDYTVSALRPKPIKVSRRRLALRLAYSKKPA